MMTEGKQMIELYNKFDITCACLGNHEFGNYKKRKRNILEVLFWPNRLNFIFCI